MKEDHRGWFQESYSLNKFLKNTIDVTFVQDNLVYSKRNVFCKIDEYLLVASKKLLKTVTIGIATIIDIKKELKYQIFIPFKFITSLL